MPRSAPGEHSSKRSAVFSELSCALSIDTLAIDDQHENRVRMQALLLTGGMLSVAHLDGSDEQDLRPRLQIRPAIPANPKHTSDTRQSLRSKPEKHADQQMPPMRTVYSPSFRVPTGCRLSGAFGFGSSNTWPKACD